MIIADLKLFGKGDVHRIDGHAWVSSPPRRRRRWTFIWVDDKAFNRDEFYVVKS